MKLLTIYRLWRAWRRFPHLRFGQTLVNALPIDTDLYYLTDETLVQFITRYAEKMAKAEGR